MLNRQAEHRAHAAGCEADFDVFLGSWGVPVTPGVWRNPGMRVGVETMAIEIAFYGESRKQVAW